MIFDVDLESSWTELPPGPELAIHLAMVDWGSLPDRELVAALEAADRQASWTQSVKLTAVGELARRRRQGPDYLLDSDTERRIAGEVSLALTATQGQAEELVWLAETLPDRLPATWAALQNGQLDYHRATVMCEGLDTLDAALTRRLDAELIGDAITTTRTLLRRRLTKAIKAADPEAHAERTRHAKHERRVELWDNDNDTCDLVGRNLDAADAHAIYNRLTAAARALKVDGDTRTLDQIRLDLHNALLHGTPLPDAVRHLRTDPADTAAAMPPPEESANAAQPAEYARKQTRPEEHADLADVIDAVDRLIAHALAEAADEQLTALLDRARAAGRLDGLSLLIGQAVHTMNTALAGIVDRWCRATGTVPGRHGHRGYRPPAAMQRLVQRRHPTCAFPTCHRRSAQCDIDHTIPYDKGGRTCKCNMAPLCRTHHRLIKQHPSWKLWQPWPGLLVWISPAGTWHIVTPQ